PPGLDLDRFRPADRRAARAGLPVPAEAPLVLYVGRLDPEKSVDRILPAFERVASTVPAAHLLLVGHGTAADRLQRLAGTLAACDRVRFLGARAHAELAQCYQAADVFLFASETETQGLVLAEAAACGLPAVAVRAPGGRRLLGPDPRLRTLRKVLVSYPAVRHILPDRISLEASADGRTLDAVARFLERQHWLVKSVVVE